MRNWFSSLRAIVAAPARWLLVVPLQAPVITVEGAALVDGAAIPIPTLNQNNLFRFSAANNNARVFAVPTGMAVDGAQVVVVLYNASGGVLNATTFNAAIKQPAAVTMPANGFHREYFLNRYNGVWNLSFSGQDIAN